MHVHVNSQPVTLLTCTLTCLAFAFCAPSGSVDSFPLLSWHCRHCLPSGLGCEGGGVSVGEVGGEGKWVVSVCEVGGEGVGDIQ